MCQTKDLDFIYIYLTMPGQQYYPFQKIPSLLQGISILAFMHCETIVFFIYWLFVKAKTMLCR